jgi:hypothetical protein
MTIVHAIITARTFGKNGIGGEGVAVNSSTELSFHGAGSFLNSDGCFDSGIGQFLLANARENGA